MFTSIQIHYFEISSLSEIFPQVLHRQSQRQKLYGLEILYEDAVDSDVDLLFWIETYLILDPRFTR